MVDKAPLPSHLEALDIHVRQIQMICDAYNIDPSEYLADHELPKPKSCQHIWAVACNDAGTSETGKPWCIRCGFPAQREAK